MDIGILHLYTLNPYKNCEFTLSNSVFWNESHPGLRNDFGAKIQREPKIEVIRHRDGKKK